MSAKKITSALISVFHKDNLEPIIRLLHENEVKLFSTGGTQKFIEEAGKSGLSGLKGHRSVGGCRASIYNPTPLKAIEVLCEFMQAFERKNG